jgi:hypothetical protein
MSRNSVKRHVRGCGKIKGCVKRPKDAGKRARDIVRRSRVY